MNKDEALNGLKHLKTIAEQLKTYSDQGQHLNIPSHLSAGNCWWMAKEIENVINACKEALEQPAQEHVAWIASKDLENIQHKHPTVSRDKIFDGDVALYTHPHQWQGLTDDEIDALEHNDFTCWGRDDLIVFGRAIEQALKEKNT